MELQQQVVEVNPALLGFGREFSKQPGTKLEVGRKYFWYLAPLPPLAPRVRGGLLGAEGPAPDATCPAVVVVAGALTAAPAATLGPTMSAGAIKGSAPVTLEVKVDSCDGVASVSSNPSKSTVSTPDASTTDASSGQKNQPLPLCLLRQQSYREPVPVTAFVRATNPPEVEGTAATSGCTVSSLGSSRNEGISLVTARQGNSQ